MAKLKAGQMVEGYQLQAPAPLDYIKGAKHTYVDGHYVKGAHSDPWWAYGPQGWAVVKVWKHKAQTTLDVKYDHEAGAHKYTTIEIPAAEVVEVQAVDAAGMALAA